MYLTQAELKYRLKKLNKDLELYTYSDTRPVNAIYYRGSLVCGIPKGHVYRKRYESYNDGRGHLHNCLRDVAGQLAAKKAINPRDKRGLLIDRFDFRRDYK